MMMSAPSSALAPPAPSLDTSPSLSLPHLLKKQDESSLRDQRTAATTGTTEQEEPDENQLSEDLALFLANPSLRAALADGSLDLATYSGQVEDELHEIESKCIAVYRSKAGEISSLQTELQECQSVLAALHEMLLGFQADLGGLSGEIRQLQEKSRTLDIQLKNRREAETGLRNFLEHIVVAPSLAHAITTGPVNPVFLKSVQELNQIYKDTHSTHVQTWASGKPPVDTVAGQEMQEQVAKLRVMAVSRVREYFLKQMALLRRPQTNVRMIQVHGLLKYAALQDFLEEACPEIASEILNVYVESMSKTLQQLFRTYQAQLLQLDATKVNVTRHDVIAIEEAMLRDSLTTRAKKRVDVFCLGNQRAADCLDEASRQPILAHVALAENQRYPYERLFRSLIGHLVDAVTNEHVFCRQFFKRDAFGPLFHGTLSLLLEQLENYLFSCHDALCLVLMIKVTHSFRRLARSRKIHSLDGFFEQVTHLLWPRLKTVMESHLRSLKQATALKLGGVDMHAHFVSRRFAEFCCSILLILHDKSAASSIASKPPSGRGDSKQSPASKAAPNPMPGSAFKSPVKSGAVEEGQNKSAGDMLLQDLAEMSDEFVSLLERLSAEHSSEKKRIVFLINNVDHVVCIFQERRVIGKEFNRFVEMLMQQRELFVEEELLTGFSKMIAFVQQTENHMAGAPKGSYDVNIQVVEALVLDFASSWKSNIEQVNRNVLSYFSNFRNGMEILKQVLTQLLLYYTRFQDIIRKVWRNKPPAFCKDLVSTTVILAEIKKYALAI
jgi:hypothetical protein